MKRILLYIAIVLSISISLFNGCMSEGDKIDYYLSDTTMGVWSQKFNKQINYYYGSSDTIIIGVDNFETWSIKTNRFIDSVPKTKGDTIIYGTDNFEAWRTKFNTSVDSSILDSVNINSYFAFSNPDSLAIPTPVIGSDECTHPDVWDMGTEWNSYQYWMAFTPLPTIDTDPNENPCIVASNDKINWEVPIGGSNPISPTPPISYNSDTELFFENGTLYCFYRTWVADPTNRPILAYKSSTDGITWSAQGEMNLSGLTFPQINTELVSPAIVNNGSEYRLYGVDVQGVAPDQWTYYLTSTSLLGDYTGKTRVTLDSTYTFLSDMFPTQGWSTWHINVNIYNGRYFLLTALRGENASSAEMKETIWICESSDGQAFTTAKMPLFTNRWTQTGLSVTPVEAWDGKYYRPAMLPKNVNGQLGWDIWYGGFTAYREIYPDYIGYSEILPVESDITYVQGAENIISASRQTQIDSANLKQGNYIFCDDFQRVESGLTTSSSGDSYSGNVANITVNNSLKITAPTATAIIDLGVLDYEISIDAKIGDLNYITSSFGNGFTYYIKHISGGVYLKMDSGRRFVLQNTGTDIQNDYLIQYFIQDDINNFKIRVVGDDIKYYVNNKLQLEFTVTNTNVSTPNKEAVMASTEFLLWLQNTSSELFNITAKAL